MLSRFAYRLRWIVGLFMARRWPWPVWWVRGGGTLQIGPESFWFHQLSQPRHAWWAQKVRRRDWERPVIRELVRTLEPGDVFVDLGAYVGGYTLLASRLVGPEGKVVAFEPDPVARRVLERNVATNGASNVTIVPYAVGSHAGTARFVATGDSVGRVDPAGGVEVGQVTLDEYCQEHCIRPNVMKVDIEGGEVAALGHSAIVRDLRELVLEVHGPQLREQGVDVEAFLEGLGHYELLVPPENGNFGVVVRPRSAG